MVVVKMNGGLGNQMFQYAAARALSENVIHYDLFNFKINNSITDEFTPRAFDLGVFPNLIGRQLNSMQETLFNSRKLFFKILRNITFGKIALVKQNGAEFVIFPKANNILLHGFFQSEKYFKSIRRQLLQEFQFPPLDPLNEQLAYLIRSKSNSVSIHVRRGDYLKQKVREYHGILPLSYYLNSINYVQNKLEDVFYIIFSDDSEWCENNLSKYLNNYLIVKGNTGKDSWKDMCLMTQCKHHIVANSSFSWWGAWLSEHNGINMAPCNWFNPLVVKYNIHDFVPDSWQIISYE